MTDRQHRLATLLAALLVWGLGFPALSKDHADDLDAPAPFERDMNDEPKIYPNPADCRLGVSSMTFTQIPASARVRLYTLQGHLLRELEASTSGDAVWDLRNSLGEPVDAGVYLALVTAKGERRAAKVAVER